MNNNVLTILLVWWDRELHTLSPKDKPVTTELRCPLGVCRLGFPVSLYVTQSTINRQISCFNSATCVCLPPHPVHHFKVQLLEFRKTLLIWEEEKFREGWFVLESNHDSSGKATLSRTFHSALRWGISWQMRATVYAFPAVPFHTKHTIFYQKGLKLYANSSQHEGWKAREVW